MLQKVTAFVLRPTPAGRELLVFQHPFAGWQVPAGTVNPGEKPTHSAIREVAEETGLSSLSVKAELGHKDELLPPDQAVVTAATTVFSRPNPSSFDWIYMRPGIQVSVLRKQDGYTQINFEEADILPNPNYTTYHIVGWVPDEVLSQQVRRHFYLFEYEGSTPPSWKVNTDNHTFTLSWQPLDALPGLIPPQDTWLRVLEEYLQK